MHLAGAVACALFPVHMAITRDLCAAADCLGAAAPVVEFWVPRLGLSGVLTATCAAMLFER